MNNLVYIFLFTVTCIPFLLRTLGFPSSISTRTPELLAAITFVIVAVYASVHRSFFLHPKYLVIFLLFILLIVAGILVNDVSPGTIVSGMTIYLKYLPFFFIPIIYRFSENDFQKHLKFILFIALAQLPIALYQRLIQYAGVSTGDLTTGTVLISSALSLFLIGTMAIVLALYIKKRLDLRTVVILLFLLFLPTTINETKGTLIFFPLAIILTVLFADQKREVLKKAVPIFSAAFIMLILFIPIYNIYFASDIEGGLIGKITDKNRMIHYLYSGESSTEEFEFENDPSLTGDAFNPLERDAPRADSILLPIRFLSEEPVKLITGLGIGNVNLSKIDILSGEYGQFSELYSSQKTTLSQMIWEMGLGGVFLSIVLIYMIFSDARSLRKGTDLFASFSLGWMTVSILFFLAFPYKNLFNLNVLNYLFWYFSGVVVSESYRRYINKAH